MLYSPWNLDVFYWLYCVYCDCDTSLHVPGKMNLRHTTLGFLTLCSLLAKTLDASTTTQQLYSISNSTSVKCETYSRVSLFHVSINFRPEVVKNRGKFVYSETNALMHTMNCISLCLLLSGDIQTNPGPKPTKHKGCWP